jgi:hypothetical protein
MATAEELLRAYREQGGLDAEDALALLVDFFSSYGMTSGAAGALCDYIDDEGMTEDFARLLRENGLVIESGEDTGGEDEDE